MLRKFGILFVVLALLVVAGAAYAFAAALTGIPADSKAGQGAQDVGTYVISNVKYNLKAADPTKLDSVEFNLDAAATTVKVQLVKTTGTWYTCTGMGTTPILATCATTAAGGLDVSTIDELNIVASSN